MQRLGERKYVSDIQELFRNRYGIQAFDKEMFETYVDIVHLGGDYREAVALYREYLSEYSPGRNLRQSPCFCTTGSG